LKSEIEISQAANFFAAAAEVAKTGFLLFNSENERPGLQEERERGGEKEEAEQRERHNQRAIEERKMVRPPRKR